MHCVVLPSLLCVLNAVDPIGWLIQSVAVVQQDLEVLWPCGCVLTLLGQYGLEPLGLISSADPLAGCLTIIYVQQH